jgi:predicted hydrocarbon binding protein
LIIDKDYMVTILVEKWRDEAYERLQHEWIRGVLAGLNEVDEETSKKILKNCGEACAKIWLDSYGYDPASYDLSSWIRLIQQLDPEVRSVSIVGNNVIYELKPKECLCPLVSGNVVKLTSKLCLSCSTSFFEYIFKKVTKKTVKAKVMESLATGANKCVFQIQIQA